MEKIEAVNLSKKYGKTKALDKVNLKIEKNKIYGLLGKNGAGKSTLLRILSKRIKNTQGKVIYGESEVLKDEDLAEIYLTEPNGLLPKDEKVRDLIEFYSTIYPDFKAKDAMEDAKVFGLDTDKKVKELSTGFYSIFRTLLALNSHVQYIFLDEPTIGFDAVARRIFYKKILEEYNSFSSTIVLSSHLINEISPVIEDYFILDKGVLIDEGNAEEKLASLLKISYPKEKTVDFKGQIISRAEILGFTQEIVSGKKEEFSEYNFVSITKPSLEDYFIGLVGGEEQVNE